MNVLLKSVAVTRTIVRILTLIALCGSDCYSETRHETEKDQWLINLLDTTYRQKPTIDFDTSDREQETLSANLETTHITINKRRKKK